MLNEWLVGYCEKTVSRLDSRGKDLRDSFLLKKRNDSLCWRSGVLEMGARVVDVNRIESKQIDA